jgi:Flp pilus assembly protein TadG
MDFLRRGKMKSLQPRHQAEKGIVLYWVAALLVLLLMFAGLAIDLGRGYIVKMQLSKAVDGAALAAGRALGAGTGVVPRQEAQQIFSANFPAGYLGVSSLTDPYTDPNFYQYVYDSSKGANIFTITASAVIPTTFMRVAGWNQMNVSSIGQATRKLVDLSLILDISGSISSSWGDVSSAASDFVDSFDETNDRISLIFYSDGGDVRDPIRTTTRGFDKPTIKSHITSQTAKGSTAMAEGLFHGWDEIEAVPSANQSGLRVIVLFTDGCANGVPAKYNLSGNNVTVPNTAGVLATNDNGSGMFGLTNPLLVNPAAPFPQMSPYYTSGGGFSFSGYSGHYLTGLRYMPKLTTHGGGISGNSRSGLVPTSFPMQSHTVLVEGSPQDTVRGLDAAGGDTTRWEANPRNVNNAARNLLEIMAAQARSSYAGNTSAPYPIRIYTIGMGASLRDASLGWRPERGEDIMKRIANDPSSSDHISSQLDGRYFYAPTAASVHSAFAELKSELLRLSQ